MDGQELTMSKNLFLAVLNRSTMEKAFSRCTCAPVLNTAWLRSSPSHATLTAVAHLQEGRREKR